MAPRCISSILAGFRRIGGLDTARLTSSARPMRVDHHAYRRATRVAGFGLTVQVVIALVVLIFGVLFPDTVFRFVAYYLFGGVPVWLSLVVIFYQHTQERLEALEEDELAAARTGTGLRSMRSAV